MMLKFVLALGIAADFAQTPGQASAPISVCEALAHRIDYNGRIITVRGEVKNGPHGSWLAASSGCEYQLATRGVTWPNYIFLAYPNNRSRLEEYHAPFQVDRKSIRNAEDRLKKMMLDHPDADRVEETYEGKLVTYEDLEKRVNPPSLGGNRLGFGPIGLDAPAQLLIMRVTDVVITPRGIQDNDPFLR